MWWKQLEIDDVTSALSCLAAVRLDVQSLWIFVYELRVSIFKAVCYFFE